VSVLHAVRSCSCVGLVRFRYACAYPESPLSLSVLVVLHLSVHGSTHMHVHERYNSLLTSAGSRRVPAHVCLDYAHVWTHAHVLTCTHPKPETCCVDTAWISTAQGGPRRPLELDQSRHRRSFGGTWVIEAALVDADSTSAVERQLSATGKR
jgi:hypothetical protein